MAEPDKRQIGDGSDNYGEAAKQMAKAAKEAGIETAKQAAVKGAEAGANAAAATVQAGVEGGKAVAEIAAGTAAGGPWGAILSAAWAMRHTLFKILVCICLFFLVIIVLIVSLPSVVTNSVFGLDGSMVDMENPTTLLESYNHLAADISAVVEEGYDAALAKVEQIIEDGGYDYDLSMDALINYAQGSAGYDVSYILAAYSASLQQRNTGKEDMLAKLRSVADSMFPVAFVEKESEQIVPFTYATYRPVTVTVVTSKTQTGTINGVPQYRYTTARRTYYEPDETITTSEPVNVAAYTPVVVSVPIYSGGRITGTRSETYYEQDGNETLTPETEVVKYVECTIQPFDNSVIIRAFGIDPSATYDQFKITYGEAIQKMAKVIRGFGGAAISATQDLSDFFGLEDGKYGRAIINNSKNKIILNLEPDEARYVQETLKLTRTEIRAITRFERGEALISSNNNKVPVVVKASKLEKEMITTDRAELEAILKERQREKTHSA